MQRRGKIGFGGGIGASLKTRVSKEVRLLGVTLTIPHGMGVGPNRTPTVGISSTISLSLSKL